MWALAFRSRSYNNVKGLYLKCMTNLTEVRFHSKRWMCHNSFQSIHSKETLIYIWSTPLAAQRTWFLNQSTPMNHLLVPPLTPDTIKRHPTPALNRRNLFLSPRGDGRWNSKLCSSRGGGAPLRKHSQSPCCLLLYIIIILLYFPPPQEAKKGRGGIEDGKRGWGREVSLRDCGR